MALSADHRYGSRFRNPWPGSAQHPIGAYEPCWFMGPVHMSPEEAVTALQQLDQGNSGRCVAGLPADRLCIMSHGEIKKIRVQRLSDA